jgi:hypothetical protein
LAEQFDPQPFGRDLERVHAEAARTNFGEAGAG